jgi:hypothetical protein
MYLLASSLAAALFGEMRVLARWEWAGENEGLFEHPAILRREVRTESSSHTVGFNRVFRSLFG